MALLNQFSVPVLESDNGSLKTVSGATVYVYKTLNGGSSPVTSEGSLDSSAELVELFEDPDGVTPVTQPLTSDAQGNITAWALNQELHFKVTRPSGLTYGISYYPHNGSRADDIGGSASLFAVKGDTVSIQDNGGGEIASFNTLFTFLNGSVRPTEFVLPNTLPSVITVGSFYVDFGVSPAKFKVYDGTVWKSVNLS